MATILIIGIEIGRTCIGLDLKHHGVGYAIGPIVITFGNFHDLFGNDNTAAFGDAKVMSIGGIESNTASAIAKGKTFCSEDGVGKAIGNGGKGNRWRIEAEVVFAPKAKGSSCITLREAKGIPVGEVVGGGPTIRRERIRRKTRIRRAAQNRNNFRANLRVPNANSGSSG